MNYAFSVTKAGTEETPIEKIEPFDYNRVWLIWERLGITIIYKYKHVDSENCQQHVHYHGMFTTQHKLDYKDAMIVGYSIILDNMQRQKKDKHGKVLTTQQHYDSVFNYCRHEERSINLKNEKLKQELDEAVIYKRFMDVAQPLRQQKIKMVKTDTLFKLSITGNI